ncbi:MAG: hypothetical protein ACLTDX_00100 [[Clostridium] innocuum]
MGKVNRQVWQSMRDAMRCAKSQRQADVLRLFVAEDMQPNRPSGCMRKWIHPGKRHLP